MKTNNSLLNVLGFMILLSVNLLSFAKVVPAKNEPASSEKKSVKTVTPQSMQSYLLIQKQLAADSFEGVLEASNQIHKTEKGELSKAALAFSKSKNIQEARESFKNLSRLFIFSTSEKERMGAKVASCPMAQAKWLQLGESLKNPYYGAAMLECGRFE